MEQAVRLSARKRLQLVLDGGGRNEGVHRVVDLLLITLISTNVLAVIFETVEDIVRGNETFFYAFEIVSVAIFTVEFLARLWTCVDREDPRYAHPLWGRLRYMSSAMALIDLAAILPFYLAFILSIDLRMLRVVRLLRLLKLTRYSAALSLVGSVLYIERRPLGAAVIVMFVLLAFASSFVYLAERTAQPEAFGSIPAAMWWGVATLSTVGYGDVTPVTPVGKVLGAIVMLLGVGMFAMPAGILASGFAQAVKSRDFVVSWNMVASVPLFARLEAARIAHIVAILKPRSAVPGEMIIRKDSPADSMYFISTGEVQVTTPDKKVHLHGGEFFGEIALIEHGLRTASVQAITTCQLLALHQDDLDALLDTDPELSAAIMRISAERRAELNGDEI